MRAGTRAALVAVQTGRCYFAWDVPRNVVRASADGSGEHLPSIAAAMRVQRRRAVIGLRAPLRPTLTSRMEQREGLEMEKVTFRFLADPDTDGEQPIHQFNAEVHATAIRRPDAEFRTRTFWFDPNTSLGTGRQCGCRVPKWEYWIDYPNPDSVSRELFTLSPELERLIKAGFPE